jgi:putative methionine-R-sulfoxide reductase with GAF domain
MRWFVEVSSLTPGVAGQRLTVEAATWQGALAQGRSSARDTAPLSNFTIEVLSDGYRATNALTRTRYLVSRAPDDAALSDGAVAVPPRPRSNPPPAMSPTNGTSPSPAATAASALVRRRTPSGVGPSSGPGSVDPIAIPGKVILRKAENPGGRSPLTYREVAIAVPSGTSNDEALKIARAHFDEVRKDIAQSPPGRLIQLAVFDHEWQGRPQRAPLVALTWKDWKGDEPEIKGAAASPPSQTARAAVDTRGVASEISSAAHAAKPAAPAPSSPAIPAAVEAAVAKPASVRPSAPPQAFTPPPAPIVTPVPFKAPAPPAPEPPKPQPLNQTAIAIAPQPAPTPAPAPEPPKPQPLNQTAIAIAPQPGAPALGRPATDPFANKPPPSSAPRSSRPDDLTSEIFESMHDVHFMRDALDGADFVVELLREKIPTAVAMVHFYDINAKQFVVVKTRGPNTTVNVKQREGTGLVGDALRTGKAIHVKDASSDQRWSRDAYSQAGHPSPKQIVIAPMRHGGRFLGALELADHTDGEAFGENEVYALSYVAEQFAEFVNERGISLTRGADSTGSFQVIEPNRPPQRR